MKLDTLIENISALGFEAYIPSTSSFFLALVADNDIGQSLYIMPNGKRSGITLKFYDQGNKLTLNENGKLITRDGKFGRHYYAKRQDNLHDFIEKVAKDFLNNNFQAEYLQQTGQCVKDRRKQDRLNNMTPAMEMKALYDDLHIEEGEDIYLSDGMYLKPDGTIYQG